MPATIVWNQGRPDETLMNSSIHVDRPAGVHPTSPSAARSPYWTGASAARVSRASDDWDMGEVGATATASAGTMMGSPVGVAGETGELHATSGAGAGSRVVVCVSGGAAVGGATSAFFEKNHMFRVARGVCTRGGYGKRPTGWDVLSIVQVRPVGKQQAYLRPEVCRRSNITPRGPIGS